MQLFKNNIFFLPWGGYGDILLATPTLKKLRDTYPEARIYCHDGRKDILCHNPCIDRFIPTFPARLFPKKIFEAAANNLHADPMIFYPSYGYLKPSLALPQRHAIDIIGDMAGLPVEHGAMRVDFSGTELDYARRFARDIKKPFVLLQTASRSPGRVWPRERWAEVVRFLDSCATAAVLVGREYEEPIPGAVSLLGGTTILQALALLTEAKFFLGVDSVFQHAACALKVPAGVLFGSSSPAVWGYKSHINLFKNLSCQPCIDKPETNCTKQQCMLQISAEEVIEKMRSLL
jgi:ADP-heptose:LPS heptosyltransferase